MRITAIPRLLDLLDLNGALVTIDAIGCQKDIAEQDCSSRRRLCLTVKDNEAEFGSRLSEACFLEAGGKGLPGSQGLNI